MKIMHVITRSDLGGAQSVLINIVNSLCRENEVIVIAGEGDGKMWELLDKRIRRINVPALKRNISIINDIKVLFSFLSIYRRYEPDVIHLHSSKVGLLGRLAFPKGKVIYTVHGFDSIRLAYRPFLFLERMLQYRCKAIIGVCEYDMDNLIKEKITNNVGYVYNGIISKNVMVDLSLPVECLNYTKKVLCIARMSKPKRFDIFLEMATLLPQYAFIWIGNQEKMMNLPNNVFCLGNIANAGIYNTQVDLFVLPSDYEGLPIVIIEAMSCGKPIVSSNVGGISEIVYNGENGYVVNNNSIDFAKKIDKPDPEEYVDEGGWKARQGGNGIDIAERSIISYEPCATEDNAFNYELQKPITKEFYELFKPFGYINIQLGNERLGEVYVLDKKGNVALVLQGRIGSTKLKVTIKNERLAGATSLKVAEGKIQCQLTKYQMCIGCKACESVCKHSAIKIKEMEDGSISYKIDDQKCKRCTECVNHFNAGCYVRKVLTIKREG